MVTAIKQNNEVRICMYPRDRNKAIQWEHFQVIADMPQAKIFSTIDAKSSFWQLKLTEESSKLCTFNTQFGRYRFKRLPFGIVSASKVFQKAVSEIIEDIEGAVSIIDDILIWRKDMKEHDERLKRVLDRVRENNLKLNLDKCQFRRNQYLMVDTYWHLWVKPDPEKVRAEEAMSPPENKSEQIIFLGFINYLTKFIPHMSEVSANLRQLLEKNTLWHWDEQQQSSFPKLKIMTPNAPILRYFDPKLPLTL